MSTPNPTRWLESPDGPLSTDEQQALQTYAARGPSAAQRARMWRALEVGTDSPGSPPNVSAGPRRSPWWWVSGGLLALTALWLGLHSPAMHSATVPAPAATTPHAESIPVQPVPESEAQPARSQPTEPEPHEARPADPQQPAAVAPQHQARRAAPASRPASRRANPAHTETASATAPDPRAELSLLTPARQLLATHPLRSLALAEEHAQRFAHGAFAEERDFLRMEALLRLDRRSEAESAARVFRRQHPQSTHLERIDALLRHP